ncbi:hypothetical protein A2U01_0053724, partial [Trifolium medium]|nr:hypothetical protein [Trifolium medium]
MAMAAIRENSEKERKRYIG